MEKLIAEIKELRAKKIEVILSQKYEEAAKIRDTEKGLLSELSKHQYFKDKYDLYLESKKEEFEKLLTEKDGFYSVQFFYYALEQIKKNSSFPIAMELHKEYLEMEKKSKILYHIENKEDTKFLNKWIIKNIITFPKWFNNSFNASVND